MRWQDSEVSPEFPRRGTCGENWGETPKSEARKKGVYSERTAPTPPAPEGVYSERTAPTPPAPEGEGEAGARPRAPDDSPEAPPPLSLDLDRAGGEEAPPDKTPGAPRDPSCYPCPPKGREEEEVPGSKTPEEVSARGEVGGAVGTEPEGREDFLRFVSILLYKSFPLSRRPNSTKVTKHVTGANIPLHLVQVGWVSRSTKDRKTPHFLSPTPGQIRIILDII